MLSALVCSVLTRRRWGREKPEWFKPLAPCRNLEHMKTKAAFKGCSLLRRSLPAVPDPAGRRGGGDQGWAVGGCIFLLNLFLMAPSLALSLATRTGRLEPAHLLHITYHHSPAQRPSSLAQWDFWQDGDFKCSFVAVCFCWLFMEPKCWKWILRKLLKVSGGCCPAYLWSLL